MTLGIFSDAANSIAFRNSRSQRSWVGGTIQAIVDGPRTVGDRTGETVLLDHLELLRADQFDRLEPDVDGTGRELLER